MNSVRETYDAALRASRRSFQRAMRLLNRAVTSYRESTNARLENLRDWHLSHYLIWSDTQSRYAENRLRIETLLELAVKTGISPGRVAQAKQELSQKQESLKALLENRFREMNDSLSEIRLLEQRLVRLDEIKCMLEASDSLETARAALRKSKELNSEFATRHKLIAAMVEQRAEVLESVLLLRKEAAELHSRIEAMREIVANEDLGDCVWMIEEAESLLQGKRKTLDYFEFECKLNRRSIVSSVGNWGFFFLELERCLCEWEKCAFALTQARLDLEASRFE
ncbi:MAG: hypothetical protein K2X27_24330 [Candidatus Obscuribacterales bacterium]|nr:hypothetical protein [Candidatus Obscuribacterales bacterium]